MRQEPTCTIRRDGKQHYVEFIEVNFNTVMRKVGIPQTIRPSYFNKLPCKQLPMRSIIYKNRY